MKPIIFLSLLATAAQAAAPVITRVVVDNVDYSMARINVRTSVSLGAPNYTVSWGYSAATTDIDTPLGHMTANGADFMVPIFGTRPGVRIYVKINISESGTPNTIWGCSGGSITQGSITGLTCDPGEAWPYYTSAAFPGPATSAYPNGTAPQVPTIPAYTFPAITGVESTNQFTVADDWSDFASQRDAALTATATVDTLLRLPCGLANKWPNTATSPTWPAKATTNWLVVRPKCADGTLPPVTGRITPAFSESMTHISTYSPRQIALDDTHNKIVYMGIYVYRPATYPTSDVAAIAITQTQPLSGSPNVWEFTVASPLPATVVASSVVILENVATVGSGGCHPGPVVVNSVLSSTVFTVYCNADSAPALDTAGSRYVIPVGAQRITSITPASGSCTGGNAQITLAASARFGLTTSDMGHIKDASGMTGLNNHTWKFASISGNAACLASSSGVSGTYVANSGILAVDIQTWNHVDVLGSTNVWFDRCWVDGGDFPNRSLFNVAFQQTDDSGFVNGRITNTGGWSLIDPSTGMYHLYTVPLASMTGEVLELTQSHRFLADNNYLHGTGILIFPQNGTAGVTTIASDITIRRNDIVIPLTRLAGGALSDGLYWAHRHWFEAKAIRRLLLDGNDVTNGWSDEITTGSNITFTPRLRFSNTDPTAEYNTTSDIRVSNNYIRNTSGGINMSSWDTVDTVPTHRIAYTNNVFEIDWFSNRAVPNSSGYGTAPNDSATGGTFVHVDMGHSLLVDHNTVWDQHGMGPYFMSWANAMTPIPAPYITVTNNLVSFNRTSLPAGGMQDGNLTAGADVAATWQNLAIAYDATETAIADPNSKFAGNVVIPGTQNEDEYTSWKTSCYASTAANCNVTDAERETYWGSSVLGTYRPPNTLNFNGTTPNARAAQMKFLSTGATKDFRLRWDSPGISGAHVTMDGLDAGADLSALLSAQGKMKSAPHFVNGSTKKVRYIAPDSAACYTKPSNSIITGAWTSDSGGGRVRDTTVTLSGATTVWLSCGSQLWSCATTAGACVLQAP